MTKACLLVLAAIVSSVAAHGQEAPATRPGNGVSIPIVLKEVKPTYTPAARAAKIEGTVLLETVVTTDGTVGEARVVV